MDRMSSIELAMKNEQTEMQYYLNESRRSKNPLAQAMFKELAKDEQEHMQRIRGLHGKLVADGAWPADVRIEVDGTNVKRVLDELVGVEGSATQHDDDDIVALEKAIDFESSGAAFYAELATACENPQEQEFFAFLANIEREHHLSLTDSLAYLRDPEDWMMQHGRAGLDGA
jgi:rubrerythrin